MAREAKHRRLPNGFGRITKLKSNLTNPYRAMVTIKKDEYGKPIGKILGYYKTYNDAYMALIEYNRNPYDLDKETLTFQDVYEKWSAEYFKTLKSKSSERTVIAAYNYTKPIRKMKFADIRVSHLEGCMNDSDASAGTKSRIKSLFNLMFDYGVKHELTSINYARNFKINSIIKEVENNRNSKNPISLEDEQILWNNIDYGFTRMILINIYSGWRPQELALIKRCNVDIENKTMIGGMKTEAGTDRLVPIHSKIFELIKYYYYQSEGKEYLFNDEDGQQGTRMTYDKYRGRFRKVMDRHGFKNYSPSCPRHTFITRAKESNVNDYALKIIVGHEITDVTEKHYTHRKNDTWLKEEIEKIK